MNTLYVICIGIGFIIPLISFLFGEIFDFFEGIFNGIDFDPTLDIGHTSLCLLPFSLQSICGGLLTFGAVGKTFYNGRNAIIINLFAILLGYIIAVMLQTIIHKLKNIENTTHPMEQLLLYDAKVIHTIIANGFGSISVTTMDGITSSYPAKAEAPDIVIHQDTIVSILRFEDKIAIVREKDISKKYM